MHRVKICFSKSSLGLIFLLGSIHWLLAYQPFPEPPKGFKSTRYIASIDDTPLFAQKFKDIHYVHFPLPVGGGDLEIEIRRPFTSIIASPAMEGFPVGPGKRGYTFTLPVEEPGFMVLTMDDKDKLFVFAEKPYEDLRITETVYSVVEAGADPEGVEDSTSKIQGLIDNCPPGSVIYFPAGHYLSGSIELKSNITLHFAPGSLLQAIPDPALYDNPMGAFIYVGNCENVSIKGPGVIDGSGAFLRHLTASSGRLLGIRYSRNVNVQDVILRNPRAWNTQILHSDHVLFDNVKIVNDTTVSNTDGINPDSSRNVSIQNGFFYCGDDAVAVKSTNYIGKAADVHDIQVTNNLIITHKSALKVGTETHAGAMKRILFSDNYVIECDRGMSLYARDGAVISDVAWRNNFFERPYHDYYQKLIHFEMKNRNGKSQVSNLLIENCVAAQPWPQESIIQGLDEMHLIKDVLFRNFIIGGVHCMSLDDANLQVRSFVEGVKFE